MYKLIRGYLVKQVESSMYLKLVVQKYGGFEENMKHKIKCGWIKWRETSGILYGKKIPVGLKGKFYKSAVSSAMMYGTNVGQWTGKYNREWV